MQIKFEKPMGGANSRGKYLSSNLITLQINTIYHKEHPCKI